MMQRNDIEKCANEVLRQYNIVGAPYLHIKEICEKEDIVVKKLPLVLIWMVHFRLLETKNTFSIIAQ